MTIYRTLILHRFYGLGILRCTGGWRLFFGFGFVEWGKDSVAGVYLPRKEANYEITKLVAVPFLGHKD